MKAAIIAPKIQAVGRGACRLGKYPISVIAFDCTSIKNATVFPNSSFFLLLVVYVCAEDLDQSGGPNHENTQAQEFELGDGAAGDAAGGRAGAER
jgi:hypothetical protein